VKSECSGLFRDKWLEFKLSLFQPRHSKLIRLLLSCKSIKFIREKIMRIISLVLALVFVGGIMVYYNKAGIATSPSNQPITGQEVLDEAKRATAELNKVLEKNQKDIENLNASRQP